MAPQETADATSPQRPPARARWLATRALFPVVFLTVMTSATWWLGRGADPDAVTLAHLLTSSLVVAFAETVLTYEPRWRRSQGDVGPDLMHLVVSNVGMSTFTNAVILPLVVVAAAALSRRAGVTLWPTGWPLVAQGLLAVVIGELPYYWFHRLSHEVEFLWRFHSVHHSAPRLYWLNAVRFHPVDALVGYLLQVAPLVLLGVPPVVLAWYAVFLGTHGPFQHANVDLKLGPLNWVFSMAELHRWHHSTSAELGNTNYGGNIILWDVVFGTRYLPEEKPSADIGVGGMPNFPRGYLAQLAVPFRWQRVVESSRGDEEAT